MKKAQEWGGGETPGPDTECFSFLNLIDSTLKLQLSAAPGTQTLRAHCDFMYSFYNVTMRTLPVTWHWVLFEYIVARSTEAKYCVLLLWFSCRPQTRFLPISRLTSRFQNPRRDLTGSQKSQLWWKGTKIVQLSNSSMRPRTALRQCYRHLWERIRAWMHKSCLIVPNVSDWVRTIMSGFSLLSVKMYREY